MKTAPLWLSDRRFLLPLGLALLVLAAYWWALLRWMTAIWNTLPAYSYGWALPFLCGLLFWHRWKTRPPSGTPAPGLRFPVLALFFALAFAASHLFVEVIPSWRFGFWALSGSAVGLTLAVLGVMGGAGWFRHFSFPIAFFLVSVPWPSLIEGPLIQTLSRANASLTAELVNLFGIPAICQGNVIEIAAGRVGIDDACSGIRSFQSTLMISLFFGELHRLSVLRRLVLCLSGFALAFAFNVVRTTVLTTVASQSGIDAISRWHDPAGVTILLACFIALWLLGLALARSTTPGTQTTAPGPRTADPQPSTLNPQPEGNPQPTPIPPFAVPRPLISAALLLILVVPWGLSEAWFRHHEAARTPATGWSVREDQFPGNVAPLPIAESVTTMLGYDQGEGWRWTDGVGFQWQAFWFEWDAGKSLGARLTAGAQAVAHQPEVCFPASGFQLEQVHGLRQYVIHGVPFAFKVYEFSILDRTMYVFSGFWESASYRTETDVQAWGEQPSTLNAFRVVFQRLQQGNRGITSVCRVIKLGVTGPAEVETAEAAFRQQLERLIQAEPNS